MRNGTAAFAPRHHKGAVFCMAFSPDGKTLATGGAVVGINTQFGYFATGSGEVILWDVASWKPLEVALGEHEDRVLSLAFSPDGKVLATAGKSEVILWNVASREPLFRQKGSFQHVAFSPDGKLLSAGSNESIDLWTIAAREPLCERMGTLGHLNSEFLCCMAFSPEGKILTTGGSKLLFWEIDAKSWQDRARRIANRSLSLQEWSRYVGSDVPPPS